MSIAGLPPSGPHTEWGWSSWAPFLRCPQSWAWRWLNPDGTRKARVSHGGAAQRLGAGVHYALALYWRRVQVFQAGGDWKALPDPFEGTMAALSAGIIEPVDDVTRLHTILHHCIPASLESREKVLLVEEVLSADLGPLDCLYHPQHDEPLLFAPTIDLITEDAAGRVWLWDHKSASDYTRRTVDGYSTSGQFSGLRMLGRLHYPDRFGGVVLNVVRTSHPWGTDRPPLDPAPAMDRVFPHVLREAGHHRAWLEARTLTGDLPLDCWPRVMGEDPCGVSRYRACEYGSLCMWGPRSAKSVAAP